MREREIEIARGRGRGDSEKVREVGGVRGRRRGNMRERTAVRIDRSFVYRESFAEKMMMMMRHENINSASIKKYFSVTHIYVSLMKPYSVRKVFHIHVIRNLRVTSFFH